MNAMKMFAAAALASVLATPAYSQSPVLQLRRCGEVQRAIPLQAPLTIIHSNPADPWEYYTAATERNGILLDANVRQLSPGGNHITQVSGQSRIYSASLQVRKVIRVAIAGERYNIRFLPSRRHFRLCPTNPDFALLRGHLDPWTLEPRVQFTLTASKSQKLEDKIEIAAPSRADPKHENKPLQYAQKTLPDRQIYAQQRVANARDYIPDTHVYRQSERNRQVYRPTIYLSTVLQRSETNMRRCLGKISSCGYANASYVDIIIHSRSARH